VNVVWAMEDRLIRPRYRIRRNSARNDRRRVLMATLRPRGDGNDAATLISIPSKLGLGSRASKRPSCAPVLMKVRPALMTPNLQRSNLFSRSSRVVRQMTDGVNW